MSKDDKTNTFAHILHEQRNPSETVDDPGKGQSSGKDPEEGKGVKTGEASHPSVKPVVLETEDSEKEKKGTPVGDEGVGKGAPEQKPAAKTPRFNTIEEYEAELDKTEKSRKNAELKMTQATMRAGNIERQLLEAQKTLGQDDQAVLAKLTEEATKKIREIPEDDPNIESKQLDILTNLQVKIATRTGESTAKRVLAEQIRQREEVETANRRLHELLSDQKIDTPDHFQLFVLLKDKIMAERPDYNDLPEAEQFEMVYQQMKPMIGMSEERLQKISEENEKIKKSAAAMGRGGTSTPERTSEPSTLGDQIKNLKADTARSFRG